MSSLSSERSASAGGLILVVRFAAGSILNYGFGVALAWLLLPGAFGTVSALQNVLLLAAGTLTAGLPWALALRMASDDGPPDVGQFRTSVVGNLGLGVGLAAAFLVAEDLHLGVVPQASTALELTVAAEVVLLSYNAVLGGALQGNRRFGGLGAMQSLEILVKCVIALALTTALHLGAEGVALGFVAGTLVATAVARRALRDLLPGWGPLTRINILSDAAPIWVGTFCFTVLLTADLLGLAVLSPGKAAAGLAAYQVCAILARAPYFVADALMDAVFPFMAAARTSAVESHAWFTKAVRAVPLVIAPLQLALFIAPGPILRLCFPHSYGDSASVLRLLDAGTLGLLLTNNSVKALYALHRSRVAAGRMGVVVMVEVAALVLLVPSYGGAGAAGAYCVASWTGAGLVFLKYLRIQHAPIASSTTVRKYATALVPCCAVMGASRFTGDVTSAALLVLGLVLYAVVVRHLGLLTDADLAPLKGLLPRGAAGRHRASIRGQQHVPASLGSLTSRGSEGPS